MYSQSSEGRLFWFGFMEHFDVNNNTKVAMITAKASTSGTISIPLQNWSQDFSVAANNVTLIELPVFAETVGSEYINDNGIRITAQADVSVYIHQYHGFRSEASLVLPNNVLNNEYYIMSYSGFGENGSVHPSEFLIVAQEDETEITVTVTAETEEGQAAGSSFNIELNTGETYQVQARNGSGDLTGSYLTGTKNFAVFGGNTWTQVPSFCAARDNLLEQMYPVSTWGKQFVSVPNAKVDYDVFRILAAADGTVVQVESITTQTYNLNQGEFVEYNSNDATYISSNQPILVAQYSIGGFCNNHTYGDPSMLLLNSIEQTRDTVTLYNSSFEVIAENYINIVTRSADADFVLFDGQPLANLGITFQDIGVNGEFAHATVTVGAGAHTIISEGCGLIATAYGYGELESYSYGGGASFSSINANPIPEGGCLNDTIFFDTGLSPSRYTFDWDLGDGDTSTESVFQHFYPNLGSYPVRLILHDLCLNEIDTLYQDLMITLRQAVDGPQDTLICEGESIQLGASDLADARYEWRGPNGYFSEEQFPIIPNMKTNFSGDYSVIGIVSGCATFPAVHQIEVLPNPQPYLGEDTLICSKSELNTILEAGNYSTYRWQDNSQQATFMVQKEGTFSVTVTDEFGCIGSDEILLEEQCPTSLYIPTAFSPNDDGVNDYFQAFGTDIISFKMSIFDRWGELIFESTDIEERWEGTFQSTDAPIGVYVWVVEFEGYLLDGSVFSERRVGDLSLIR